MTTFYGSISIVTLDGTLATSLLYLTYLKTVLFNTLASFRTCVILSPTIVSRFPRIGVMKYLSKKNSQDSRSRFDVRTVSILTKVYLKINVTHDPYYLLITTSRISEQHKIFGKLTNIFFTVDYRINHHVHN